MSTSKLKRPATSPASDGSVHEWEVTHTGWILLAPILIANIEDEAPVPIPRWRLWWWYELNMWINDNLLNEVISWVSEEAVGYMFWGVRQLKQSRTIRVPAAKC